MNNSQQDNQRNQFQIGQVYLMQFDGVGNEQTGWRPGVVFQNNIGNQYSPNIIALPLTSSVKKQAQITHVLVLAKDAGLKCNSMVLCENPERMSKSKIGRYITTLSDGYMRQIAIANLLATAAISFLSEDDVVGVWKKSVQINHMV